MKANINRMEQNIYLTRRITYCTVTTQQRRRQDWMERSLWSGVVHPFNTVVDKIKSVFFLSFVRPPEGQSRLVSNLLL